ncbi:MAG: succinate dehydrogenase/fumarate reductase iron-sulfur subunit [Gaiellales bacterium]|jgi:succinate dehydrogenase / fumarate reductase iron-sulfur subunit|nr:succinate dehydrogenase/fumarate reductase iron-sulfur subunit [Gaiellales bacterium]
MEVTLKIHRYNPETEHSGLETYTVQADETATLLDVLDVVKDEVDGSLSYRKSCRMAVCGSCGMRMNGAAVLACKTPMKPLVDRGEVPVISPMGNLPVIKDLVVDMGPFWEKFRAIKPYLDEGSGDAPVKEWRIQQEQLDQIMKEALCIQCGCCVSECNSMEADPDFLGPAALAKAARFVYDVRDRGGKGRLERYNGYHGVWDCTRCYFCNERCPKGVDPRDAIAKVGARIFQEGMRSDKGARHAKVFVDSSHKTGYLLETNLVPETVGALAAIKEIPFAMKMVRAGKVPNPLKPHKAGKLDEVRRLNTLVGEQEKQALEAVHRGPAWPAEDAPPPPEDDE